MAFMEQMYTVPLQQWVCADPLWEPLLDEALIAYMMAYLPLTSRRGNSLKIDM